MKTRRDKMNGRKMSGSLRLISLYVLTLGPKEVKVHQTHLMQ